MLCGVTGHQRQVRSGPCCTLMASSKACPPPIWVIPAVVAPITHNSNSILQQFQDVSIQSPPLVHLEQTVGFKIAVNSSACAALAWTFPQTAVP